MNFHDDEWKKKPYKVHKKIIFSYPLRKIFLYYGRIYIPLKVTNLSMNANDTYSALSFHSYLIFSFQFARRIEGRESHKCKFKKKRLMIVVYRYKHSIYLKTLHEAVLLCGFALRMKEGLLYLGIILSRKWI